jgi:hypothetical protein
MKIMVLYSIGHKAAQAESESCLKYVLLKVSQGKPPVAVSYLWLTFYDE